MPSQACLDMLQKNYSLESQKNYYLYLDCLYLSEKTRGKGIGAQIMNKIKVYAKSINCSEIQWQTPDFNKEAIDFYKKLGADSKTKERFNWKI